MTKKLSYLMVALLLSVLPSIVFAQYNQKAIEHDLQYFSTTTAESLTPKFKKRTLRKFESSLMRDLATQMLEGTYNDEYRYTTYKALPSPRELERTIKLGQGFSKYENLTGMFLEKGENVLLVSDMHGKDIELWIPNYMRKPAPGIEPTKDPNGWGLHKQVVKLHPGVNIVDVEIPSNAYIYYFDDHSDEAPAIDIHFITGKVNGYFDLSKHDNEDWNRLLDQAVSPVMDAVSKHMQVAYPVEFFQKNARGRGVELLSNYDKILTSHYNVLGLVKYNKVPKNRMFARVNWNYYMFRDGDGVAYLGDEGTMRMVSNPEIVIKGDPCWGFSHEAGHALQMRQITWPGMTETSVNIFSMFTTTGLGNESRLKQGNYYEKAYNHYIKSGKNPAYLTEDVFVRLVPLWQLHLYFAKNGHPDFYADVMEEMRKRPNVARTRNEGYKNMLEFTKICSDVSKTDLTDFFQKYGFFWVGNLELDDYGKASYQISQQEVDAAKAYIASKKYKKPVMDITLIKE